MCALRNCEKYVVLERKKAVEERVKMISSVEGCIVASSVLILLACYGSFLWDCYLKHVYESQRSQFPPSSPEEQTPASSPTNDASLHAINAIPSMHYDVKKEAYLPSYVSDGKVDLPTYSQIMGTYRV